MNILIIDEVEQFEPITFDFLLHADLRLIGRMPAKDVSFLNLEHKPDIVVVNFADVRDNSGHFIRKLKQHLAVPILGILHVINDLQIAFANALGVDDCVFFPFSNLEVTARLKALVAPQASSPLFVNSIRKVGPLEINMEKYEVKRGDLLIQLTRTEFMILSILASNTEKVFLKEEMYQKLWNDKYYDNGNALNVHIRRLRKKLETDPENPELIVTKWGIGYKFQS